MIAARLAAGQVGLGHEVSLLTHPWNDEIGDRVRRALEDVPRGDEIKVRTIPRVALQAWRPPALLPAVRPFVEAADVVHLHSVWEAILVAAARGAHARGTPYFVLLNGMLDPWSLSQRSIKKKIGLLLGRRWMLDHAAALHLGNADEQNLIKPLGIRAPGVIIPNGVFEEEVSDLPAPGGFFAARPELEGRPFMLFLSRLHYKKGLDHLAVAFEHFAQHNDKVDLVVAGPDGGARAPFEAAIADAGLQARVHVVGPLYGRDKLAALVDAECFLLPSRQEGFSVAITEALGCGKPVVITEGCHFPEVGHAEAGVVTPVDGHAFGAAMVEIMADPARRARMGENARRLVLENYTWPRIAARAVDAYRDAIDRMSG